MKEKNKYAEAAVEVLDILNHINKEEVKRIPESFINSPYQELSKEIYERYSISNWIKEIINYE